MSAILAKRFLKKGIKQIQNSSTFNLPKQKDFGKFNAVQCGKVSPERPIPDHIIKPDYYYCYQRPGNTFGSIEIKNEEEIAAMRASCKLAATILNACQTIVKVGNTTDKIDEFVHQEVIDKKAYPSPLRYAGFPKSVCTSVNNVACHGIPDDRPLEDGDIINIDITVFYNGFHGDCSKTFLVGNVDDSAQYLVKSCEECLENCITLCAPGVPFQNIGRYITGFCKQKNLSVIPAFIGHGIGSYFHGPPEILHYENSLPGIMGVGMTFTIEPILSLGGSEIEIQEDGWTAISVDGARSAQFEHTVLITEDGAEALTKIN